MAYELLSKSRKPDKQGGGVLIRAGGGEGRVINQVGRVGKSSGGTLIRDPRVLSFFTKVFLFLCLYWLFYWFDFY